MDITKYLFNDIYQHDVDDYPFTNEYYEILKNHLSKNWNISKDRIFLTCNKKIFLPKQGWKIHISSSLTSSIEILRIVVKILDNYDCYFKVIGDPKLHQLILQKTYNRKESGKFITIYPKDNDSFLHIIEKLYEMLKDYDGQYILTDRRYKDCSCIYYRYGAYKDIFYLNQYGDKVHCIEDPDGNLIEDKRYIPYKKPSFIEEILDIKDSNEKSILLSKYKILKVLHMSNSGGIYLAKDLKNNLVVIKEARKNCSQINESSKIDAQTLLEMEYENLKKFVQYNISPKPIELLKDWENEYLVEEYIDGVTVLDFVKKNNPAYHGSSKADDFIHYFKEINRIIIYVLKGLEIIYKEGEDYSDLSMDNVMITKDHSIKLLDFESSGNKKICLLKYKIIADLPMLNNNILIFFFGMILKHENMLWYDTSLCKRTIQTIQKQYKIKTGYEEIVEYLLKTKKLDFNYLIKLFNKCLVVKDELDDYLVNENNLLNELETTIDNACNKYHLMMPISSNHKYKYDLGYGILGINQLINEINLNDLNKAFIDDEKSVPLGLLNGMCGVAWKLIEKHEKENASKVIKQLCCIDKFSKNYSLGFGLSGLLMVLEYYSMTFKSDDYLKDINNISNELVEQFQKNHNFCEINSDIPFGFIKGPTGIALVLMYASILLKDKRFIECGIEMLQHEIANSKHLVGSKGLYLPYSINDNRLSPYFSEGTAGLVSVIIRYNYYLKEDISCGKLEELIMAIDTPYCIDAGQFQGMSGIGDTFIDLFIFTRKEEYLNKANRIKDALNIYCVNCKFGVAIPTNGFQSVSFDYGDGLSGIVSFLNRLDNFTYPRLFFLDSLLEVL